MNDEKLLIDQAKRGNHKAFTQLYNRYWKLIRYIIYDIVKDDDITKDLVSNTFTKAFQKLNSYVNPISFEAWLKTIAVNTTIDWLRATKEQRMNISIDNEDNYVQVESEILDPESDMIKIENLKTLKQAMSLLRTKYQKLLKGRYYDHLSYEQLSVKLGIPIGTLKSDLCKAKHKLRENFQKLSNY